MRIASRIDWLGPRKGGMTKVLEAEPAESALLQFVQQRTVVWPSPILRRKPVQIASRSRLTADIQAISVASRRRKPARPMASDLSNDRQRRQCGKFLWERKLQTFARRETRRASFSRLRNVHHLRGQPWRLSRCDPVRRAPRDEASHTRLAVGGLPACAPPPRAPGGKPRADSFTMASDALAHRRDPPCRARRSPSRRHGGQAGVGERRREAEPRVALGLHADADARRRRARGDLGAEPSAGGGEEHQVRGAHAGTSIVRSMRSSGGPESRGLILRPCSARWGRGPAGVARLGRLGRSGRDSSPRRAGSRAAGRCSAQLARAIITSPVSIGLAEAVERLARGNSGSSSRKKARPGGRAQDLARRAVTPPPTSAAGDAEWWGARKAGSQSLPSWVSPGDRMPRIEKPRAAPAARAAAGLRAGAGPASLAGARAGPDIMEDCVHADRLRASQRALGALLPL